MSAAESLSRFIHPLALVWAGLAALLGLLALALQFPPVVTTLADLVKVSLDSWIGPLAYAAGFVLLYGPPALAGVYVLKRRAMLRQQEVINQAVNAGPALWLLPRMDSKQIDPASVGLWGRLLTLLPEGEHIAFELAGGESSLAFSLRAVAETGQAAFTQIMSEPGWQGTRAEPVKPDADPVHLPDGHHAWQIELRPASRETRITPATPDPLMAVLAEIGRMPFGVRAGAQVLVRRSRYTQAKLVAKAAQLTTPPPRAAPGAAAGSTNAPGKSAEQKRVEKGIDERSQHPFAEARLLVWATAPTEEQAQSVAGSLARTLSSGFGQSNSVRPAAGWPGAPFHREFPLFGGEPWADDELALVAHLVGADALGVAPQLRTAPAKLLPPAAEARVPRTALTIFTLIEQAQAALPAPLSGPASMPAGPDRGPDEEVIQIASPQAGGWLRRLLLAPAPRVIVEDV